MQKHEDDRKAKLEEEMIYGTLDEDNVTTKRNNNEEFTF